MQFLFYFFLFIGISHADFSEDQIESINKLAEEFRLEHEVKGLSLTVVKGPDSFSTGYGKRDEAKDENVDQDTLFAIASVSKSFTAVLAVKVLNEKFPDLGERALDTPLTEIVTNANFTFVDKFRHESVTFRDLLAHRTCLNPDSTDAVMFQAYENYDDYIYRLRYAEEMCSMRTHFLYNNGMYEMASYLIEFIAQKPFKELANAFFTSLGMTRTKFITKNWNENENIAQGYFLNKNGQIQLLDPKQFDRWEVLSGSGGILSTASDMEKYLNLYLNKGSVGGVQILPEEVLNWLYRPSMISDNSLYALGLNVRSFTGYTMIHHTGFIPPFSGVLSFIPESNMGIYSVASGPSFIQETNRLGWENFQLEIYKIINGSIPEISSFNFPKPSTINIFGTRVQSESLLKTNNEILYEDLVGIYGNRLFGDLKLSLNGTDFIMEYGLSGHGILTNFANNSYLIEWNAEAEDFLTALMGPLPPFNLDVINDDTVKIAAMEFKRGATKDTFPEIPWKEENECPPPPDCDSALNLIPTLTFTFAAFISLFNTL